MMCTGFPEGGVAGDGMEGGNGRVKGGENGIKMDFDSTSAQAGTVPQLWYGLNFK